MATASWVSELDRKEHKNWVMVGCALNIAKNGITPLIQRQMVAWYQSLISNPPLQSLPLCTCAHHSSKCPTCTTWKKELGLLHKSRRPKICWDNSDRQQWGSPAGAWEIAKVFMPTLGTRKGDVTDAKTTDIGGLLNMLEWCPFIHPTVNRAVLSTVRDEGRNHWAHSPKQQLQDADLKTIFGHLNNLLNDPVFKADIAAQQSSKELQDLFHHGLVSVRESEVEALHLLRQTLVGDLTKCKHDLTEVQKQGNENREDTVELKEQIAKHDKQFHDASTEVEDLKKEIFMLSESVENYNRLLNDRPDLQSALEVISKDLVDVKGCLDNVVVEINSTKCKVANLEVSLESMKSEVKEVTSEVETLKAKPSNGQSGEDIATLCTAPCRLQEFTGRESVLVWLEQYLVSEKDPIKFSDTSCCTKAICGLGGCGKTSLAIEFAWRSKNHFTGGVFWINGESDENVRKSVVENLALLNIPASTSESVEDSMNKFLAFLSNKHCPWLLIVDNADELTSPKCPSGVKKICKGPWQRNAKAPKNGHILFTTRQNAVTVKTSLKLLPKDCWELQSFTEDEGALFLMQRTSLEGESLYKEAINLTKELGGLPLALEQAAAYISALPIPCTFKAYLDKYRHVKLRLLERQLVAALSVEAQHRLSVHTTWEMNFEFVAEKSPAAATMMRIASFVESENIPLEIINPGLPALDQEELREAAYSEIDIAAILKVLTCYSLFSVNLRSRVFSVHKLVQEVVRASLTTPLRTEALVAASRVLHFALSEKSDDCGLKFKNSFVVNWSEVSEEDRNVLIALLLNCRKLKDHLQSEINSSRENFVTSIYSHKTFTELFQFAYSLIGMNVSFHKLNAEISAFQLQTSGMYFHDDPQMILNMMVTTSVLKRNCSDPESYKEAEKLAKETVQKLYELEKSGAAIDGDTKFRVLEHRASYYAMEGQWQKNYKALLQLESLKLSDAKSVELQMLIGRAENYASAGNFKTALKRHEYALKLARKLQPLDLELLLRVLQHMASLLKNEGMAEKAKPYAEEMLTVCKEMPHDSDYYIKGMTSALGILSKFDGQRSEEKLLKLLKERWPHIHESVMNGFVETSAVIEDGSDEHAAQVLETLIDSWFAARMAGIGDFAAKPKLRKYLTIAQILLSIRQKFYGETHPALRTIYMALTIFHRILRNDAEVQYFSQLLTKCNDGGKVPFSQGLPPCDTNVYSARELKKRGNSLFEVQDYHGAAEAYTKALLLSPNDAKLLSNRAATYLKLSERQCSLEHKQRFLEQALVDSQEAIVADPTWAKGYYRKAVSLALLGRRGPSLATAAIAQHLFPSICANIPIVVEHFGDFCSRVVNTIQDLQTATEKTDTKAKKLKRKNKVILMKEGEYLLERSVEITEEIVIVGDGKVSVACKNGAPFHFKAAYHIENVEIATDCDSQEELQERSLSDTEPEVIRLATPPGYENTSNECKVN